MTALFVLSIVLGALMACSSTVVAFGGKRVTALCGYAISMCSVANALAIKHAPAGGRLALIVAATVLLAVAIGLTVTRHGNRRPKPVADKTGSEPEDEVPAGYRGGRA